MSDQKPVRYHLRLRLPDGGSGDARVQPPARPGQLQLDPGRELLFRAGLQRVRVGLLPGPEVPRKHALSMRLQTQLGSAEAAHAWLAAHPVRVEVDGVVAPAHATATQDGGIAVSFEVEQGRHRLVVASVPPTGPRLVWMARECTVAGGG